MKFSDWLAANGYNAADLEKPENAKQLGHLKAAWEKETAPPPEPPKLAFDDTMKAIEAENTRVTYIREATAAAAQAAIGQTDKIAQLKELCAAAIADKGMDRNGFNLALLRLNRSLPAMVTSPNGQAVSSDVIEAALAMTERLPGIEKHYAGPTLEAAHKRFKRGLGLQEFLCLAAEVNGGYRGTARDLKPLLRAAYAHEMGGGGMMADAGPSTIAISGILSNIANKFLRTAFEAVEQSWREICTIRPVNDFKTITTYSLVGDNIYEEVGAGGKIKDGSLGQTSYTNAAKSYAKLLGLDERDIRNDDLGALTGTGRRLGRGGALKLNAVFWTAWLDDSTFFPTNKGNNNYDDGATDSVLTLAGLTNIDAIFRAQTNPQAPGDTGTTPLGSIPKILLVPTALRTTGWNLMNSQYYLSTGVNAAPTQGSENPWRGQFKLVDSTYLGSANTNGSDTAWYLLSDPNDISGIEVVFLDGMEMPMIEVGDPDFDTLGLQMRGRYYFGSAKQEYRCGVKAKGAA